MENIDINSLIEVQGRLAQFILDEGVEPYQYYEPNTTNSLKEMSYLFVNDDNIKSILEKWKIHKEKMQF